MATDREAARRQRLRGAQTRDVVDADTSFGFRLPGAPSTIIASETIITEAQISTPTPAGIPRRGRQGIGGTKRSSPTQDIENNGPNITAGSQDGLTSIAEQLAKRQRRAEPAPVDDSTSRVQGRNQRLRGAQLRSPGVGIQDFDIILPAAAAAAPSIVTADREIITPAEFPSTTAQPVAAQETAAPRDVTPEYQILAETTNTSIRSSGARSQGSASRSLRSSARRNRGTLDRDIEVSESPAGKPGSGRRVRVPAESARSENSEATETAARRLNDVVGTPTRAGRGSLGREDSPTLTVERPREEADEREGERDNDVDMDELSPDRPKTQKETPRRSVLEEDVSLESVRESIEGKDDKEAEASPISDTEAAAALRRNRAPKASYVEKRPDLDEEDEGSDQYEESADEEAEADNLTAAQQRNRLAKVGRKKRQNNPDIASPAVQKPPKNKTAARSSAAGSDPNAPRKRGRPPGSKNQNRDGTVIKTKRQDMGPRSKETIAVQTYRLSIYNPPPELEAEGDDDVEEILTQPIPFPSLPRSTGGVNSIDVLSQILNEVLQSALESLEQGAAHAEEVAARRMTPEKVAERREYRTKLRAVEAWGEAAGGALMEMGLGLDSAVAMGRRVKELERVRLELRERLSEIRRERERVGVRGDGVRSRHEREGGKREVDRRLQNAIEGVGVVVGVCREAGGDEEGGEARREDVLTRVEEAAKMVGSRNSDGEGGNVGDSEGLLGRLRRLNGMLERAAGALEGR